MNQNSDRYTFLFSIYTFTITSDIFLSGSNDTESVDYMKIEVQRDEQITCRDCIQLEGKIINIFAI